ncbi:MAG: MFS transporter [Polyangia bacterium]
MAAPPPSRREASVFSKFPRSFWAANAMEIFERMGWYGFYSVSTLYLTGAVADGGLGLTSRDRGVIQGLAMFFLYFFPALFGTLADRYGYRRMFLWSAMVMVPGYLLLHLPRSFFTFFLVYLLVACGHGMFKPVVISTVVKSTNERTGTLGFGIFYMMVNIGGLVGPIVAGVVRGWSWDYVFYASAGWLALMGALCLLIYREPQPRPRAGSLAPEPLAAVLGRMVAVVGNARFFALLMGVLVALVMGSKWWSFKQAAGVALLWLVLHLVWDLVLRLPAVRGIRLRVRDRWYLQTLRIGEGRYLVFLLLMSGFWTCYNQLAMTLPEYIRDYADTRDLVRTLSPLGALCTGLFSLAGFDTSTWGRAVLERGQIKPEHLINLNSLGIIFLQIPISWAARRLPALVTIIAGVLITATSFLFHLLGPTGWLVVTAVMVFSLGEMLASPKSKEYAGRIAPPDKVGTYMGYFYLCVALGNLFGGLLSGVAYQGLGKKGLDRPDLLWILFAVLCAFSAFLLWLYDRWLRRNAALSSDPAA